MYKKFGKKALASIMLMVFIAGAFNPAIGDQIQLSGEVVRNIDIFEEETYIDLDDISYQKNDEIESDAAQDVDDFVFIRGDSGGGSMPLNRRSSSFYDSVGRVYKRPANYMELVSWYLNLEQNYSGYIDVFKANELYNTGTVPKTGGGSYDLYYVRVTNESRDYNKPEVYFCGGPHGGEKIGAIGLYWTLDWLMRHAFHPDYDGPDRDYLRWLLDNREVYINVFHNPDGFDRGVRGDYLGRDLNREHDHASSWGPFTSVNGQTLMHFVNDHLLRTAAFFHTGARKILYPWQVEHTSISGVSPISGRSYARVPADFYFFDAAYLKMGDYIGDYDGNLGPNQIGSSYSMGMGGGGVATSWGYAGNNLSFPLEDQYVELGPHLGAGILTTTLEMSGTGNPAESTYGNDTVDRFGAEVRRIVLYLTDLAQPSVHWTNGTTQNYMEIELGDTLDVSWLARGCLAVDNTRIQYSTHPDPINNPMFFTQNIDDHHGDYYGGSYWDNAESGITIPTVYQEGITFTAAGDYFIVAKAMVDQKYTDLLRPDYYGDESYLRLIQERTNTSFYESLEGADGLEETTGQLWWYSPIIHVMVRVNDSGMSWYNDSWAFRKQVTFNHTMIENDLTDFPILINITDPDLASKAQSNGNDILFTDNYQNKIDHEIEYYEDGHLIAWVTVPVLLSTVDTVVYMYYGNSTCGDQQNVSGVWDENYMMVQHLSETSGSHYDSTSNANDGTPYGGITQDAIGQIDGADEFDNIDDHILVPHHSTLTGYTQGMTASAWVKLDTNTSQIFSILTKYNGIAGRRGWQLYYDDTYVSGVTVPVIRFVLSPDGTNYTSYYIPYTLATNTWYHIVATWTSSQRPTIYVNGVAYLPTPTGTISSIHNNSLEPLYIGDSYTSGRVFDGIIDEVRISNIARSEAWIKTSYTNQIDSNGFISMGDEKGPMFVFNPSPGMNSIDIPRSTSVLGFNITHLQDKPMNYTVETVPDIGSDSANGVSDGRYELSISGLSDCITYRWYVNVTDGIDDVSEMFVFTTECQDPWWNAEWLYRKKITIDSGMTTSDLTDFPVLLSFFDSDVGNKAQADGDDIVFADKNGVQLDHEIEQFDSSNLIAWVKIPTLLSTQNTYIYMYYGNADAENQQNPSGVWDENYMMVQHLSETSGTHYDSTSNANDGTPMNDVDQLATGKIDGANRFDGINDYVEIPHNDTLSGFTEAMTASVWVKLYDDSSRQTILNKYDAADNQRSWALDYQQDAGTQFGFIASESPGSSFIAYIYDYTISPEVWYYVTLVWQADQVPKMYVNGVQVSTSTTSTLSNLNNNPGAPLFIGRAYDSVSPQRYIDGIIDEVQVSNVARSTAWITASYLNQHNPFMYIILGSEESEHPLISEPLPFNGAADISILLDQLSFKLTDRQGDLMDYTVETSPDIGYDSGNNVSNGRYYVDINGLAYETTYTWFVNATDGDHDSSQIFTFTTEKAPIPWWNTDYSFRKEIILDHTKITEDLNDFPVLISFNDSDLQIKARNDGLDIVFADYYGNKLDYEIEYYQNGKIDAWVRIPYYSSTIDTNLMIYYGNPDAVNEQNTSNVWDSNYMMVQHLQESPANGVAQGHVDSASHNNHGTAYGFDGTSTSTTNAIGFIDGANWFDGSNDYIEVPHNDTLAGYTEGMTASAWVKFDTTSERRSIVGKYAIATPQRSWNLEYVISPSRSLQFTASPNGAEPYSFWNANVGTLTTDTWYHIAVGWQSNELPTFYLNGNKISLTSISGDNLSYLYNNENTPLYIGRTYTTNRYWDGLIDEVRVSNINRSASWIKTSYDNQVNPLSFYSIGNEEMGLAPDEPFVYNEDPQDESTMLPLNPTLSISVLDYQDDTINVLFRTNASGSEWVTIGSYLGVSSGTFTQETSTMNTYSTTYYWSVNCSDYLNHWTNKTYSFTTKMSNYAPTLTNPYPSHGATGIAPIPSLSITVNDVDDDLLTIIFKTNCTGSWQILGQYNDVPSGTYSLLPEQMNESGRTYYWSVHCFDGVVWENQTYHFTMSSTIITLKWMQTTASTPYGCVVASDINGDGAAELFQAGGGMAHCLDGKTGEIIWQRSVSGASGQPQMADCNGDGIDDLIVTISSSGIEVLHGANGTTYWRTTGLGGSSMNSPVAFDIDGDGRAEVFYASQDITNGWNGTGRVTSLTHDGRIVNQIFSYRPCAGGLSLADTDFDGQFELYMGDRHQSYSGDGGVPRGLRAFLIDEDGTIHCKWNRSDILMSSHCPMIADVNGDGKLDIVACHQVGGIWVIDSTNGATIKGAYTIRCSDGERFPGHYQPSLCDIDGDGCLEVLAADGDHPEPYTTDDVAIWDLVNWKEKALLPHICKMGPTTGDVIGNGQLDVLVSSYSGIHIYTWNHTADSLQFVEGRTGLSGTAGPALVTDIDGDGYNELVVATSTGRFYVYDTFAPSPTPRALAGIQHYSTYRNGQAIYTEPPGIKRPLLKDVYPVHTSINVDPSPQLSVKVIDYQHDLINITISTNASGAWVELASYTNMKTGQTYSILCSLMNETDTTYYWRVTATDGIHVTNETFELTTYSPGAFLSGWLYRRRITLNQSQIESDLIDFPVLIDIIDAQVGAKSKPTGDDLLFTAMDGETILDYEIEYFNNSMGHLVAWVQTNLTLSNGSFIYLYYGNEDATSHENREAVWDSHYMMVHHLSETSGTHNDSTMYHNDGTALNGVIQDTMGKIDGADEFDGVNDYITVPHQDSLAGYTEGLTASTWFKLDTVERRQTLLCKYQTTGNQRGYYLDFVNSPAAFHLYASSDGSNYVYWTAAFTPLVGEWYHVAFTWAPDTIPKFYVNGQKINVARTATIPSIYNNTLESLRIGTSYATSRQIDGMLDEIRISDIARTEAWIKTSYNNQHNPSDFHHVWDEEVPPALTTWEVTVTIHGPDALLDTVIFGEALDASDGQDSYDTPKPPMPSSPFIYSYFDTNLSEPYNRLWKEYRKYPGIQKTWDLSILWWDSGTGPVNITWSPAILQNTEYTSVILRDLTTVFETNMLTTSYYNYTATSMAPRAFEIICSTLPTEYHYEIILWEEWNMISVPFNYSYDKSDITVEFLNVNYSWDEAVSLGLLINLAYGWNEAVQNYEIVETLHPGESYWLYTYHNCSLWLTGEKNNDNLITTLAPQWNFIGLPFNESTINQDIVVHYNGVDYNWTQATTGGNPTGEPLILWTLYYWDSTDQYYLTSDSLIPGYGYWLYAYYVSVLKKG